MISKITCVAILLVGGSPALMAQVRSNTKLMIFGGDDHETYLGCLNCSKFAVDSIQNKFGTYGSSFSSESIFNRFSEFGSMFSATSVCNRYATDPPVIVDKEGAYYGRLTLNRYHPEIGIGRRLIRYVESICQ